MKTPFQATFCFPTLIVMDTEKYFSSSGEGAELSEMIKGRVTALQNNAGKSGARRLLRHKKYKTNPLQPVATVCPEEQNMTVFFFFFKRI